MMPLPSGHLIRIEEELLSTNTAARQWAIAGAPTGAVVVARRQTAGRGRRGHQFFSPDGGLYFSVILRQDILPDAGLLTSCAAVAVCHAVEDCCPALHVGIKWIDDLYVNGKKICGILAESSTVREEPFFILGIGINVKATAFPPDLQSVATSLGNEGATVDRERLLKAVLSRLDEMLPTLADGSFLEENRRRSILLGKPVTVVRGLQQFDATAVAITDAGHLTVRMADGNTLDLSSGEVNVKQKV